MRIVNCQIPIAVGYYPKEEDVDFFIEAFLEEGEKSKLYDYSLDYGGQYSLYETATGILWGLIPSYSKDNGGAMSIYPPEGTSKEELQEIIEMLEEGILQAFYWDKDGTTHTISQYLRCELEKMEG